MMLPFDRLKLMQEPGRWPPFSVSERKPREWLLTISGLVLLFVLSTAIAMGYLVTRHPGKAEPNPGIAEEQRIEQGS